MYQTGQKVVYGVHGVCVITELETRTIDRKKITYFVLEPLNQPGARYYVPTENPVALKKMNPLLTKEQLEALLSQCSSSDINWIADENQRKMYYRELIGSGDRRSLVIMVHTLHVHKKAQEAQGKKIHLCDDNFLRDAEKLLCSEFSLVLGLSYDETGKYLRTHFQQ